MTVYYRVIEVWCKYPFHQEIDYRYCVFSLFSNYKTFDKNLLDFRMDSQTSIEQKKIALSEFLGKPVKNVIKLKH